MANNGKSYRSVVEDGVDFSRHNKRLVGVEAEGLLQLHGSMRDGIIWNDANLKAITDMSMHGETENERMRE